MHSAFPTFGFSLDGGHQPSTSNLASTSAALPASQAALIHAHTGTSAPWTSSQDQATAAAPWLVGQLGLASAPAASPSANVSTSAAPASTSAPQLPRPKLKKPRRSKHSETASLSKKRKSASRAADDGDDANNVEEDDMMDVDMDAEEAGLDAQSVTGTPSKAASKRRDGNTTKGGRKKQTRKSKAGVDGAAGAGAGLSLPSASGAARMGGAAGSAHASAYTIAAAFRRPKASDVRAHREREASTAAAGATREGGTAGDGVHAGTNATAAQEDEEEVVDDLEEEEDEEEEDAGLVQEEAQRQAELSEARKSVLGAMMQNMTAEQLDRFEAYSRTAISRPNMKRLVNHILQQSVSDQIATIFAGAGKIFVGEIVELARDIASRDQEWLQLSEQNHQAQGANREPATARSTMRHTNDTHGKDNVALAPHHLREAAHRYRAMRERPGHYAPAGGAPGLGKRRTIF
ncbi:Transcription initiation factor TFIID, subunit TAF11 [Ceraceosorus bombacis]|uniref:Transcription initiation factor TFIID, subunit TAF11 n=1 Tax=Ceraceosorus bombacis TaxID=401625 RepID=A0A0N7LB81_9BASI|nr:Transcription initiation factor TFIID, subunit TAF11 [Ceraceosorus bombacis]